MDWQEEKDELFKRIALARNLGGPEKIERQHKGGRLTVRERIDQILDQGSFQEIGATAGAYSYDDTATLSRISRRTASWGGAASMDDPW